MSTSSTSSSSSSAAVASSSHDASTPCSLVFAPPPLPDFLSTPPRSTAQCPPTSRPKFRRFAWSKLPPSRVVGRSNVWTTSDRMFHELRLDFERMEQLFSTPSTPTVAPPSPSTSTGAKYSTSVVAESSNRCSGHAVTLNSLVHSSEVSYTMIRPLYHQNNLLTCLFTYLLTVTVMQRNAFIFCNA